MHLRERGRLPETTTTVAAFDAAGGGLALCRGSKPGRLPGPIPTVPGA